jgi:hypothetical protein
LEGGPPVFGQDFPCPALLEDLARGFPYGALTRSGAPFQALPVPQRKTAGLVRVRSPLLTESHGAPAHKCAAGSLLMSFPPANEMFQFAGFASPPYRFGWRYPRVKPAGGLPHSEIPGSASARLSPGLFAACYVLPRLSVPRHPPDALCVHSHPPPSPAAACPHLKPKATQAKSQKRSRPRPTAAPTSRFAPP